jgi:hypothetical protein
MILSCFIFGGTFLSLSLSLAAGYRHGPRINQKPDTFRRSGRGCSGPYSLFDTVPHSLSSAHLSPLVSTKDGARNYLK